MKFKGLRLEAQFFNLGVSNKPVDVSICSKFIMVTGKNFLPRTGIYGQKLVELIDYNYTRGIKEISDSKYNVYFNYKAENDTSEMALANLNWFQRQKLYLIMGDHIILNSGNFKWLITTVVGAIFFWYQAKQNDKLVQANKDITSLKDSLNKYQNLTINKSH